MLIVKWLGFAIGIAAIAGTLASFIHTLILRRSPGDGLAAKSQGRYSEQISRSRAGLPGTPAVIIS
ncbi:MAG TPA: hypothetical protein VGM14_11370 [Streptosporangiaceae bacterium]|jgi:hypothetical protein